MARTPREFANQMEYIFTPNFDLERSHGMADDLLCEILKELGYGEGVKIFEDADKWYA